MQLQFEWASLRRLQDQAFFIRTMELYHAEEELKTPIHDSLHWSRRFEYPWVMGEVYNLIDRPRSILDVGAGATAMQFLLSSVACPVTSIDPDESAVKWVNKLAGVRAFNKGVTGGLPKLPFEDKQFDAVICVSVMEHLDRGRELDNIWELVRVARKNVIITMDICLEETNKQTDYRQLEAILPSLGFRSQPQIPPDGITFFIDGHNFAVACLHLKL